MHAHTHIARKKQYVAWYNPARVLHWPRQTEQVWDTNPEVLLVSWMSLADFFLFFSLIFSLFYLIVNLEAIIQKINSMDGG